MLCADQYAMANGTCPRWTRGARGQTPRPPRLPRLLRLARRVAATNLRDYAGRARSALSSQRSASVLLFFLWNFFAKRKEVTEKEFITCHERSAGPVS